MHLCVHAMSHTHLAFPHCIGIWGATCLSVLPSAFPLSNLSSFPAFPTHHSEAYRSLTTPHNKPLWSALSSNETYSIFNCLAHVPGEKLSLCQYLAAMAGTGPEYDYPVTGKDEPIPVVGNEDLVAEAGTPVVGEDAREMNDKEIAEEERLEAREAGEWSEDMASNKPLPGEEDPDLYEKLPSDRG